VRVTGTDSPFSVGKSTSTVPVIGRVRADALALVDQQGIAGYRRPRIDLPPYAVAQCPGAIGKERG
jgi:hypothetical protein